MSLRHILQPPLLSCTAILLTSLSRSAGALSHANISHTSPPSIPSVLHREYGQKLFGLVLQPNVHDEPLAAQLPHEPVRSAHRSIRAAAAVLSCRQRQSSIRRKHWIIIVSI